MLLGGSLPGHDCWALPAVAPACALSWPVRDVDGVQLICQLCDPSWLRVGWDRGDCAATLSKHARLLALIHYTAIVLVLWQTAPAPIIFGFLLSYGKCVACC